MLTKNPISTKRRVNLKLTIMLNWFLFTFVAFHYFRYSTCWVFNNVDFSQLAAKNLLTDLDNAENEIDLDDLAMLKFSFIYPGTKWCGAGNIADGYEDLGTATQTDRCCREHDLCPDEIPAGETKHNLTNDAIYTRLSCQCDEKFRFCLHSVGTQTSAIIGNFYFNALGTKCFREDYPVIRCKRKGGWLNTKCIAYSYDFNGEKRYQWFDLPKY